MSIRRDLVLGKVAEVIKENYIKLPPIDVCKLVMNYGLGIQMAVFKKDNNICGFLDMEEKKIWVNYNDSQKRRNFTIAHELGHWLLHRKEIEEDPNSYKILFRQPLGSKNLDEREQEANLFAARLLVPTDMLKICKQGKFTVEDMSDLFGVSKTVVYYRLEQEGLDD